MTRRLVLPLAASALLAIAALPGPAAAQDMPAPDARAPDTRLAATELTLSGTGTVHAAPDRLTATLFAESAAATAAAAQGRVNALVRQAMDAAHAAGGVTTVTEGYSVQHDDSAKPPQWVARQTIRLAGADGTALLDLVGRLQARGLGLSGLDWSLSPDRRQDLTRQAESEALKDVRRRADSAAATLGLKIGTLRRVALGDRTMPRPMPMMMMAARAAVAPSAPAEEQDVTASATATFLLHP
ncbi:protein of unknown function DUF541 [Gluconacetobacter diazotrophicus PA1 5]|uniref:Conserved protein n=2 Tax=Gluconacetobacter diazotrophicus TaxID=33996 RepID=A9HFQ7_GLUDA|nr:SIMPL domain-containing protein [Gluconacetobacter diazotrophicus]ACI51912.1 protein of unknown function DUF541 [Gluconacetobacter diazotrophicus PA1 5]MBB2155534.1 SIMPL domain-containing protein [Gluconacetobacter diazotrophicus]TWB11259.1 uncharacterized protein YggE [Gluconacetobacter diazotrophicus]CAP55396.1 conserved protein [Gluconacetobacter diazotrophicus PA1 5]